MALCGSTYMYTSLAQFLRNNFLGESRSFFLNIGANADYMSVGLDAIAFEPGNRVNIQVNRGKAPV